MGQVSANRVIAADPTSVALLLADPAVVELWPAAHRGDAGPDATSDRVAVRVGEVCGALRVLPPTRTPTAFVLRFDFDALSGALPHECTHVEGRLELAGTRHPATDGPDRVCTDVSLELRAPEELQADAELFLTRVAEAAERRARAA